MSAQDFDSVLAARDDASFRRLYDLTWRTDRLDGPSLPTTAEKYLLAFCDETASATRRRWIGVALRKMLDRSPAVVKCLKRHFPRLGQVILGTTEPEETKILAAIIIRQGLELGIKFPCFWPTDKVPNSLITFPRESGPRWMDQFQKCLDTLGELAIVHPATDPGILYPIALMASDDYKWRDSEGVVIIALIQNGLLTIIIPDLSLRDLSFVDIPLHHIQSTRRQRSTLHDSQARGTKHEPWDLVLSLKPGTWTYRINTSEQTGDEFTILFANAKDAEECDVCLKEIHDPLSSRLKTSSSQVLDISRSDEFNRPTPGKGSGLSQSHSLRPIPTDTLANSKEAQEHSPADAGLQWKDNTSAIAASGQATTGRSGTKSTPIVLPSASSTSESRSVSPNNERPEESTARAVRLGKQQQKSIPGALPKIKKPPRTSNATGEARVNGATHRDEFDFPDESPRIKRPSVSAKKGLPGVKPTTAVVVHRAPLNSATKAKPIRPKPKPSERGQANDTEDEEDSISSQNARRLSETRTNAGEAKRVKNPPAQGAGNGQEHERSQGSKTSALPKISKVVNNKALSKKTRLESDVFAIPLDDEPKVRPRARRTVVKSVKYKEAESSESESSESDHSEFEMKKTRSPVKAAHAAKQSNIGGVVKPPEPKSKAGSKKARVSKAETQPLSPVKHPVISEMLSKSQPILRPESEKSKLESSRGSPMKKIRRPVVEENSEAEIHEAVSPLEPHIIAFMQGARILNHLEDIDNDPNPVPIVSNPLTGKPSSNLPLSQGRAPKEETIADDSLMVEATVNQKTVSTSQRKRSAEPGHPSTPRKKRTKRGHAAGQPDASHGEGLFTKPPATMAPPRVLSDPSSPLEKQMRPTASQSIKSLVHNLKTPQEDKHDNPRAAPVIWRQENQAFGPRKLPEKRQTPLHEHPQRNHSGSSANTELLSSNSKPVPASPHAESTAISGHADTNQVDMEKELGDYETARSDPFKKHSKAPKSTAFTRRLTEESVGIEEPELPTGLSPERPIVLQDVESPVNVSRIDGLVHKPQRPFSVPVKSRQPKTPSPVKVNRTTHHQRVRESELSTQAPAKASEKRVVYMEDSIRNAPQQIVEDTQPEEAYHANDGNVDMGGDETLVAQDEEPTAASLKAHPIRFRSSPPTLYSPSSHSSTSVESEPETEAPIPTSEAEELEWEASLQPHQRAIQDQLIRVSKHVLRHIVDNETAVSDIAETHAQDGEHLLNTLLERHGGEFESVCKDVERKKDNMRKEFDQLAKRMAKETERFEKTSVKGKAAVRG